jgi:hypothetical protein
VLEAAGRDRYPFVLWRAIAGFDESDAACRVFTQTRCNDSAGGTTSNYYDIKYLRHHVSASKRG